MTRPTVSARGFPQWIKDPDAVKDYSLDWSEWLDGDEISSSGWTAPSGLTVVSSAQVGTVMTVWLSGGVAGQTYKVTNRITTANNPARVDERTFEILCRDQ